MARCFPNSLYAGIDLLIEASFRSHAIAEVNAFGDLLPGIMHEGHDTYGAEIATLLSQPAKENQHPDGASSRGQMEASAP
jgi:hypothetical protein